jgi:hypothetical protein
MNVSIDENDPASVIIKRFMSVCELIDCNDACHVAELNSFTIIIVTRLNWAISVA